MWCELGWGAAAVLSFNFIVWHIYCKYAQTTETFNKELNLKLEMFGSPVIQSSILTP